MKKLLAFLLIFALLTGAAYAEDALLGMLEKARAFLAQEDIESAEICLDIAYKLDPTCAEISALQAQISEISGDYESALEYADRTLALSPADGEMYLLRSKLLSCLNRPDEAKEALKYARICGVSSDFEARIALAEAYVAGGQYENAVSEFDSVPPEMWLQKDGALFKKALLRTGNRQRAVELGLYKAAEKDETLRRGVESGKIGVTPIKLGDPLNAPVFFPAAFLEQNPGITEKISADCEIEPDGARAKLADAIRDMGAEEDAISLLSASPSGETLIFNLDGVLGAYRNGELTALLPNLERGAKDAGKEQLSKLLNSASIISLLDQDSFAWSHDERYVAITFGKRSLTHATFFDLMIADTFTGELFLANATPKSIREGGQGALFAAFDQADEFVYYLAYGALAEGARCGLCRYSLQTGETELLHADGELLDFAGLYEAVDGSWYAATDVTRVDETQGLKHFTLTSNGWTAETEKLPLPMHFGRVNRFLYASASGLALLTVDRARYFQILNTADGTSGAKDAVLLPEAFTGSAEKRQIDEAFLRENSLQETAHQVVTAALSPDGYFALILTVKEETTGKAWVMDMETLALAEVVLPEDNSLTLTCVNAKNRDVPTLLWLDENRVLLPTSEGGVLCEMILNE